MSAMQDEQRDEANRLRGALDMVSLIREEMAEWLEEAQDESKRETLENVVGHLGAVQEEYRSRYAAAQAAVTKPGVS